MTRHNPQPHSLFQLAGDLSQRAYDAGLSEGQRTATAIDLGESGYGSSRWAIVAIEFKGLRSLIDQIRARQWRRSGDNPGCAYMGTAKLIHIHHGDDHLSIALLKCATHYDI